MFIIQKIDPLFFFLFFSFGGLWGGLKNSRHLKDICCAQGSQNPNKALAFYPQVTTTNNYVSTTIV
jgi:hypothetical protein